MKTLLLSLFLVANILTSQSQSTIYGVQYDSIVNMNFFVSIDPSTSNINQLNSLPNVQSVTEGNVILNDEDEEYVFISNDTLINTIDINTGTILSSSVITTSVVELNYDKVSNNYFALEAELYSPLFDSLHLNGSLPSAIGQIYYLVTINSLTGNTTRIDSVPVLANVKPNNSAYNSVTEEFVFITEDNLIYTIDVNTGAIISTSLLPTTLNELQLNIKTGNYYSIATDPFTGANSLVIIDPSTGVIVGINTIPSLNDFIKGTSTLDTLNNVYTIVDNNDSLIAIRLNDGFISSSQQLNNSVSNLTINTIPAGLRPMTTTRGKSSNATFRLAENQINFTDVTLNQVKAYPNPATNQLTIEVSNTPTSLNVYDYKGVLVKSEMLETMLTKIDVSKFENGLYFFTLSNSEITETKKIIVQ